MPRPIETIAESYEKFAEGNRDVAYAVTLLKSADQLIRSAEESEQVPQQLGHWFEKAINLYETKLRVDRNRRRKWREEDPEGIREADRKHQGNYREKLKNKNIETKPPEQT